ncbi:MAG: 30S ribosomal protein S27ae [Nanoarchaeota archaeon]|nr:30S ribosomal protein S27ae [Nanoarchaeota archaeon]
MATKKGGSKKERKGKKPHKNKPTGKKYSHYSIENGSIKRNKKHCPRCGPGTFLANHKNRLYCGWCKYTEFGEKKE